MPQQPRRLLIAALFLLVASWAAWPVLEAGFHGAEVGLLERARASRSLIDPEIAQGHLLASLDLAATAGRVPAVVARLESYFWLLLAALALGRCARRLLLPWSGGELARAAGWASSLVFALHPVAFAAVASVTARADLMALCFSTGSLWAYLHARQQRSSGILAIAALCAVLAGLSSDLALSLPAWLAAAEFLSANRQRSAATRGRSALAVAAVSLACVLFDTWIRSLALDELSPPQAVRALGSAQGAAALFERLGSILFPVNVHVLGALGFALAGLLALAALQPILVAARSAPRLWGRILGLWALALLLAELVGRGVRVQPTDLRDAEALLLSAAVLSVGLGLGSVAMSGVRRVVTPLVLALGLGVLSHFAGIAHRSAGVELADLQRALAELPEGDAWIVDSPEVVLGVRCAEGALAATTAAGAELARVDSESLVLQACDGRLERARAEGLGLLLRGSAGWRARAVSAPSSVPLPAPWFRDGISPALELDPLAAGALVVRGAVGCDTSAPPQLAWRAAGSSEGEDGRIAGVWSYLGEAPEAVFDLRSEPEWLAAGRVGQVWSAAGWSRIAQAEFAPELPEPLLQGGIELAEVAPNQRQFLVRIPSGLSEAEDPRSSWRLRVACEDGSVLRIAGEREGEGPVRFPAPSRALGRTAQLEHTVDGVAIERRAVSLPQP